MAITINDNFNNFSPKSMDNKYMVSGLTRYATVAAANAAIPGAYRHLGLTVLLNTGGGSQEYWYKEGTADLDLVIKDLSYTLANNGLTKTGSTIQLGGTLIQATTINGGASYTLKSTSSVTTSIPTVEIENTGLGVGLYSHAVSGTGIQGNSNSGSAIVGISVSGIGVVGTSGSGAGGSFSNTSGSTNTVEVGLQIMRQTTTAAVGVGASIGFSVEDDSGAAWSAGAVYSKWIDVVHATRTCEIGFTGTLNGLPVNLVAITGAGLITLAQGLSNYANDAAAAGGGIPINGLYRNGSVIQIRVT